MSWRRVKFAGLITALLTFGGDAADPARAELVAGGPVAVLGQAGGWSWWVGTTYRGLSATCVTLPLELADTTRIALPYGVRVDAIGRSRLRLGMRRVELEFGHLLVASGWRGTWIDAGGARLWLDVGARLRIRCRPGTSRLAMVEQGRVIVGGRPYRAGTALRWKDGTAPRLRSWPRGAWVRARSGTRLVVRSRDDALADLRRLRDDPGRAAFVRAAAERTRGLMQGAELAEGALEEGAFRRALLRLCAATRRPDRWLGLAFLLETGTSTERAAAANLVTVSECLLLRHVLASMEAGHGPPAIAARAALRRCGLRGALGFHRSRPSPPLDGALAGRIEQALAAPHRRFAGPRLEAWARIGFTPEALEAALHVGGPSERLIAAEADPSVAWEDDRSLLELPAFVDLIRRRRDADGRVRLDHLAGALADSPERRLPVLVARLEALLGRSVSSALIDRVGLRLAGLLTAETVASTFQPPGEDLFLR